jgi:hypothetical protein
MLATDEEVETDAELFDCDDCPVREALEGLWPENADAWRMFHRVVTRFAVDMHAGAEIMRRLAVDIDADDFGDLVDRFSLIYDLLYPPAAPTPTADT